MNQENLMRSVKLLWKDLELHKYLFFPLWLLLQDVVYFLSHVNDVRRQKLERQHT